MVKSVEIDDFFFNSAAAQRTHPITEKMPDHTHSRNEFHGKAVHIVYIELRASVFSARTNRSPRNWFNFLSIFLLAIPIPTGFKALKSQNQILYV